MGMRKDAEIKAEAEALELPPAEHTALMLVLEVFLDMRKLLNNIDSWVISIDSQIEQRNRQE